MSSQSMKQRRMNIGLELSSSSFGGKLLKVCLKREEKHSWTISGPPFLLYTHKHFFFFSVWLIFKDELLKPLKHTGILKDLDASK